MVNHYLTPGAIIDSSHTWDETQTFADSTSLAFGTGSDSQIYYNGTDTFWDLRAAGTGDLMIALAGSFPSPDAGAVHIWAGDANQTAPANSHLIVEHSGTALITMLGGAASLSGLVFGDSGDADNGALYYTHGATPIMTLRIDGGNRLNYTAETFAFQEETTISTIGGALILAPAGALQLEAVVEIIVNDLGLDVNFKVEGENDPLIINTDGERDNIGFGARGSAAAFFTIVPGNINRALETSVGWGLNLTTDTITSSTTDTDAIGAYVFIGTPTLAAASATYTASAAATVYIAGAPVAGSNAAITANYGGLWVVPSVRFDNSLWVEGTPTEGSAGEQLTSGGAGAVMTWAAAGSQREVKQDIELIEDHASMLQDILDVPNYRWKYDPDKRGNTGDFDTLYVGPMADEAPWAMHHDGRILNPLSTFGYTVSAIKALAARIQDLEDELARR